MLAVLFIVSRASINSPHLSRSDLYQIRLPGNFLAMLELIKLNHLQVEQEQLLGEIVVVRPEV